ncbi:FAD-binding oxidoreductase [Pseudonocardia endophytica]|nr:FAD-binding oxidoreductase [Pseudonocardia endophytica]
MTTTRRTGLADDLTDLQPDAVGATPAASGFQLGVRHRPDVTVVPRTTSEVRTAVRAASDRGLPVTVLASGHGTRDGACGGVLIDTRRLDSVAIDPVARTARVGAGVRWGAVVEAAEAHGLRPPSGSFPGVGAIGYTFGGGIGLVARSDGWATDHVRAFEVVDASGSGSVTADSDPAAFARLRGSGPAPGEVVTAMTIGLLPAGPLTGGALVHDLGAVGEPGDPAALHAFHEWTRDLPDDVTAGMSVVPYPDRDVIPPALRGRRVARIAIVVRGDAAAAGRLVAPLRSAVRPRHDTVGPLRPTDGHRVHAEPADPHAYTGDNVLVDDLAADGLDAVATLDGPMTVVGIRHLGGALARPADVPDTVDGRNAGYLVSALAPLDPEQAIDDPAGAVAAADPTRALGPFASRRTGTNRAFAFGPRPS